VSGTGRNRRCARPTSTAAETKASTTKAAFDRYGEIVRSGRTKFDLEGKKKSGKLRVDHKVLVELINRFIPSSPSAGFDVHSAYALARDLWIYQYKLTRKEEELLRYQLQHLSRYGQFDLK
jgi:hypothetical protein